MRRFEVSWWIGVLAFALAAPARADERAPEEPKESGVKVSASKDGFVIQSEDGAYRLKVTGYAQGDARLFVSDDDKLATNTFVLRRVRPIVQGTLGKIFDFSIVPDFGGGTTVIQDAYLDARYSDAAKLRVGKFKEPVGLERLQSGAALVFVERATPTSIAPNRDVGVQLHGDIAGGVVSYAAGVFNGVVDGGSGDGDTNDGKDVAGRVFLQPFKKSNGKGVQNIAFGIAATSGRQEGALPSYKTAGQITFFTYATGVVAGGSRTRVEPQASYQNGPFRLFGEYIESKQTVKKGTDTIRVKNSAWETTAAFVLTGETPSAGVVSPKDPFEKGKGWGALELAVRYSVLDVDPAVFTSGLGDATKSAGRAKAWAVGLNWHLTRNVKYVANFERTTFEKGRAGGNRKPECAVLLRAQVAF
jgi:phosphate-selective porin OprO/OprP